MERMFREAMGLAAGEEAGKVESVPLEALLPSPQPRRRFEALEALAQSIREKGVLQPLLVRPLGDGRYAIVAGERRYRAAKMAGLSEVPVRVLEISEKEARLLALVENLQREDLNPYEETLGVLELLSEDLGKTREEVVSLLHRMRDEARGKVPRNVSGNLPPGLVPHPVEQAHHLLPGLPQVFRQELQHPQGLLVGVQVLPLQVLHQGEEAGLFLRDLQDPDRDLGEPRHLRRPVPPLPGHDGVPPVPQGPHQEGLEDPLLPDALGQGLEGLKAPPGLRGGEEGLEGNAFHLARFLAGRQAHGLAEHAFHDAHLDHLLFLKPHVHLSQKGVRQGADLLQNPIVPHGVNR